MKAGGGACELCQEGQTGAGVGGGPQDVNGHSFRQVVLLIWSSRRKHSLRTR